MAFLFGPSMIVAPLGGVLADRVDKRRTLIIVNVVAMLQASVLFALTLTGVIEIWQIYALALVAGVVGAIEMPLRQAFVAELVPREDLVNAIALSSTSFNLSRVIGPAIAGLTIATFGVASNFGINALSYVSVIIGLLRVDPSRLYRTARPDVFPSVRASLAEGLRLRTPHPERAVAARPAGWHGGAGDELPDPPAALRAQRARHGRGGVRRVVRRDRRRRPDRIAGAGVHGQPATDEAPDPRAAPPHSWPSRSRSASRGARWSPSRS